MGRSQTLIEFTKLVLPIIENAEEFKIGLVGGSPIDPEIESLPTQIKGNVIYIGIDSSVAQKFEYLDLNQKYDVFNESYDLIICSQVLEHLWNLDQAFSNFNQLLKPGGHLWLGCPASNFVHGSPEYFSAGYAPVLLEKLGSSKGFAVLSSGFNGTPREYLSRHILHTWFSERQLRSIGIIRFGIEGNLLRKIFYNLKTINKRLILMTASNQQSNNLMYACETWAFFQKE